MHSIEHLIDLALAEDIGPGDITTENLVPPDLEGEGFIVAKENLVLAGIHIAEQVFKKVDPRTVPRTDFNDGDDIETGETVLTVHGSLKSLLEAERTALNFLQRLSGIATHVRSYMKQMEGQSAKLVDTRKTTPGWRVLEKYAVRVGGAKNHRMGLYDGVLIKDNHIAVCGGLKNAVSQIRKRVSHLIKIEVEVTSMVEVEAAVAAEADVIMLDNMDIEQIRTATKLINGRAVVEVSGGVTQKDLIRLAETGIDIISVGALTHGARAVDLSMRIREP